MPRKKTSEITISNLEKPAKKPLTTKNKVLKPEGNPLQEELSSILGEDVGISFRTPSAPSSRPEPKPKSLRPQLEPNPTEDQPQGRSSRTPIGKAKAVAKPAATVEPDDTNWDEELPIPSFRSRSDDAPVRAAAPQSRPAQPQARPSRRQSTREPKEEVEEHSYSNNHGDDEGSSPLREYEPTASFEFDDEGETVVVQMRERSEAKPIFTRRVVTEAPVKAQPEKIIIPPRALIDIPEDAPQIVMRNGLPTLVRESRVYPNFWFYAAPPDEERLAIALEEIRQAAEAGVHVFSIGLEAVCDQHNFDGLLEKCKVTLARIVKADPDAQVVFHIDLVAPKGWEIDFPEGVYRDTNGDLAEPSLSDDKFWDHVEKLVRSFGQKLLALSNAKHILGLDLDKDGCRRNSASTFQSPTSESSESGCASDTKMMKFSFEHLGSMDRPILNRFESLTLPTSRRLGDSLKPIERNEPSLTTTYSSVILLPDELPIWPMRSKNRLKAALS